MTYNYTMKTCSKCRVEKPVSEFHRSKSAKDGLAYYCKACNSARVMEHRAKNMDAYREYQSSYAKEKAGLASERARMWRANNQSRRTANNAERKAISKKATPPWVDRDAVNGMYELARVFRGLGLDMQVDHFVPLKGKSVCGLHCEYNLRLSIGAENNAKRNRWDDVLESQLNFMR